VLKEAKGYYGARSKTYKKANETLMRAWAFAYRDRRVKKRMMRRLWIVRINAAARDEGLSYSRFMNGLSRAGVQVDRKVLADMAVNDPKGFGQLAGIAREHLPEGTSSQPSAAEGIPHPTENTHA
jgi:large subunit ribosomal protein L20